MQTVQLFQGPGPENGVHAHEFWEFQAVLSGSGRWHCRGEGAFLGPGDVFFAGCHTLHRLEAAQCRVLTVRLWPGWVLGAEEGPGTAVMEHPEAFDCFVPGDGALFSLLLRLEAVCREAAFGWELSARGLALELLGAMLARYCHRECLTAAPGLRDSSQTYAQRVQAHLERHYHTSIDLDQIAAELGLTKGYVCRVFKQHTGTTIINYVNQLRCRHAIELVEQGCSVTQAALQVGFNDYNYFSRVFKKTIGKRPSDFITTGGVPSPKL